jgi:hypothetical protein
MVVGMALGWWVDRGIIADMRKDARVFAHLAGDGEGPHEWMILSQLKEKYRGPESQPRYRHWRPK